MLTHVTPPCYLAIGQPENCTQADYHSHQPLPPPCHSRNVAFKNAFQKPFWEFGVFEPPILFLWCLMTNAALSLTTTGCLVAWLHCVLKNGPKFGSRTSWSLPRSRGLVDAKRMLPFMVEQVFICMGRLSPCTMHSGEREEAKGQRKFLC